MQTYTEFGTTYISRMTFDEKEELVSYLKPVKTYDYVLLTPDECYTRIIAIKARSIICSFDIPVVLPGILCCYLPAMLYRATYTPDSYNTLGELKKGAVPVYGDIIFATLDQCLKEYLYISMTPDQYIIQEDCNILCTPAYHMIRVMEDTFNSYYMYRRASGVKCIDIEEHDINTFRDALNSLKADDGCKLYKLTDKHIISIFAGMVPLNKVDKLDIKIYDNPMHNTFLVDYIVQKKKSEPITVSINHIRV